LGSLKLQREVRAQQDGQRAIDLLVAIAPELSRQQVKHAMQKGAVWLKPLHKKSQRRLRRVTQPLKKGDTLFLYFDEHLLALDTEPAQLIADEQQCSVWNKPAGMLAQGTLYGDHCSLLYFAEQYFKPHRPCYLVHRLDSAASGIMLLAHSERAAASFSALFQRRAITKRYRVVVEGLLDKNITLIDTTLDDKEAVTRIEHNRHREDGRSELAILIETGRKHQIRRHLAGMGHPVIGDREYGSSFTREPLQLQATELSFTCPLTQQARDYRLLTE
jgi:tRNA pseudouridine32 synthase/23S rRNA pseudouridine746 synthase